MRSLRQLLARLWPMRRRSSTGVRPVGRESFIVTIDNRSYWVHAQHQTTPPVEYVVWTSDVRDITNSPTIVSAPPAAAAVVPEVRRRLDSYFEGSRVRVRHC